MSKKYAIVTSSDAKYGDFLINHWLKSLLLNIDRKAMDIIVLDYGLTDDQKKKITPYCKIIRCKKDGHVVNIRFRDMLQFFKGNKYAQIMSIDGGDIIFQSDIMPVFKEHPSEFRIVSEGLDLSTHETALLSKPFTEKMTSDILKMTHQKKGLNAGVIIAPYSKFITLCKFLVKHIKRPAIFGPDQVLVNYFLYKHGFKEIDKKYNFIIATATNKFKIKKGVFLDENNKPIAIIHNAGGADHKRPVRNFGHGPRHNKIKWATYCCLRVYYGLSFIIAPTLRFFLKRKRSVHK